MRSATAFVVLMQFLLFLLIGVGMYVLWQQETLVLPAQIKDDAVFGFFIVHFMPGGNCRRAHIAAVLAASMASLASSLSRELAACRRFLPAASSGPLGRPLPVFLVSRLMTSVWGVTPFAVACWRCRCLPAAV